jgi:signal transduction histidine kinase
MQTPICIFNNLLTLTFNDTEREEKYFNRLKNTRLKLILMTTFISLLFISLTIIYYTLLTTLSYQFHNIYELVLVTICPGLLLIQLALLFCFKTISKTKFLIFSLAVFTIQCFLFNHLYWIINKINFIDNNWACAIAAIELTLNIFSFYLIDCYFIRNLIGLFISICYATVFFTRGMDIDITLRLIFVRIIYLIFSYVFEKRNRIIFYYMEQLKEEQMKTQNLMENMKCGIITFNYDFKDIKYNSMVSKIIKELNIDKSAENDRIKKYLFSGLDLLWKDEKLNEFMRVKKAEAADVQEEFANYIRTNKCFKDFILLGIKREFNLIVQIFVRYNELFGLFEFILNDITAFAKQEEEVTQNQYKTLFLSKICHEFRNPISNIIHLSEYINDEIKHKHVHEESENEADEDDRYLDANQLLNILREGGKGRSKTTGFLQMDNYRMSETELHLFERLKSNEQRIKIYENKFSHIREIARLMNLQILDFEMLTDGNSPTLPTQLAKSNIKLYKLIDDCIEMFNTKIKLNSKKIKITKSVSEFLPDIYTDDNKLRQIIINLLSNCYKFTSCGTIHIEAEVFNDNKIETIVEKSYIVIKITDTGIGIDEDKLKLLRKFSPFTKFEKSQNKYGLGLGLTVVKHLVDLIGKELEIYSTPNEGTTVSFKVLVKNNITKAVKLRSDKIFSKTIIHNASTLRSLPEIKIKPLKSYDNINIETAPLDVTTQNQSTETVKVSFHPRCDTDIYNEIYKEALSENNFSTLDEKDSPGHDYCVLIVEDEVILRKAHSLLVFNFFNSLKKTVKIIECEDGADGLYQIYTHNKNGKKIDLILSDESMNFLRGSTLYGMLKNLEKENVLKAQKFFLVTSYENFLNENIDKNLVVNKPLTITKLNNIKGSFLKE